MKRLIEHLESHKLPEKLQSAYKQHHCTEAALMKMHDDIIQATDRGMGCPAIFLDMLATLDTADADMLMDILHNHFGLRDDALSWFRSNLTGRTQQARVGNESSPVHGTSSVWRPTRIGSRTDALFTTHPPTTDYAQEAQCVLSQVYG